VAEPRRCACPCNKPLPADAHARRCYLNERHRDRAYRDRLGEAAEAAGVSVRLSLGKLAASGSTGERRTDAKNGGRRRQTRSRPRPRPGLPFYLKPLPLAEEMATALAQLAELVPEIDTAPLREEMARALERRRKRDAHPSRA
jgi:hypothetical protein